MAPHGSPAASRAPRRPPHRRPLVRVSLLVLLAALLGRPVMAAAEVVTVDPAAAYQVVEGWGTSLCWWAVVVGGWSEPARTAVADLLFDPAKGLGLNIVRYNIGGGDAPGHAHMRVGGAVPGYRPTAEGPYERSADANQRWLLTAAIQRGANVVEAFANSPPWWLTESGCTAGARNPRHNNLRTDAYEGFAAYLADVLMILRDEAGVRFRTLDPFNEPDGTWWEAEKWQDGCRFDEAAQSRLIKALRQALTERRLETEISAADFHGIDWAMGQVQAWDEEARAAVGQVNVHAYRGTTRAEVRNLTQRLGKRLWMSEYDAGSNAAGGPGHDHASMGPAIDLAAAMLRDLRDLQPQAWVFWQAVENEQYCTWWTYNYGLLHGDLSNGTEACHITRKYHAMAHFSRFVRPGSQMVACAAEDGAAFLDRSVGRLVLVSLNAGDAARRRRYSLSTFTALGAAAAVHRTSASEEVARVPDVPVADGGFEVEEPAWSLSTYIVEGAAYEGVLKLNDTAQSGSGNRFEFVGEWAFKGGEPLAFTRDNHWGWRRDDVYRVHFRGTGVRLIASRDPTNGIAAVSLDGGAEERVDLYAAKREDQAPLYASPVLPRGDHVLTVRVTGEKCPDARHAVVPADRADIVP